MKLAGKLWTFVGIMLGLFLYTFMLAMTGGVTLMVLWNWFVVPLGVAGLGLWWAMGLLVLYGFLKYDKNSTEQQELIGAKADAGKAVRLMAVGLWNRIFLCLFVLAFGFLFHGLM